MYSNELNLVLQSHMFVRLLEELHDKKLYTDELLDKICFYPDHKTDLYFKDFLKNSNGSTQGGALLALYATLVLPKELLEKKYKDDYKNISDYIEKSAVDKSSTYQNDNRICLQHIRNAVAHGKVEFTEQEYVIFRDSSWNKKSEKAELYTIKFRLLHLVLLIIN